MIEGGGNDGVYEYWTWSFWVRIACIGRKGGDVERMAYMPVLCDEDI